MGSSRMPLQTMQNLSASSRIYLGNRNHRLKKKVLKKFSFWQEDWTLDYNSSKFSDFPDFPNFL